MRSEVRRAPRLLLQLQVTHQVGVVVVLGNRNLIVEGTLHLEVFGRRLLELQVVQELLGRLATLQPRQGHRVVRVLRAWPVEEVLRQQPRPGVWHRLQVIAVHVVPVERFVRRAELRAGRRLGAGLGVRQRVDHVVEVGLRVQLEELEGALLDAHASDQLDVHVRQDPGRVVDSDAGDVRRLAGVDRARRAGGEPSGERLGDDDDAGVVTDAAQVVVSFASGGVGGQTVAGRLQLGDRCRHGRQVPLVRLGVAGDGVEDVEHVRRHQLLDHVAVAELTGERFVDRGQLGEHRRGQIDRDGDERVERRRTEAVVDAGEHRVSRGLEHDPSGGEPGRRADLVDRVGQQRRAGVHEPVLAVLVGADHPGVLQAHVAELRPTDHGGPLVDEAAHPALHEVLFGVPEGQEPLAVLRELGLELVGVDERHHVVDRADGCCVTCGLVDVGQVLPQCTDLVPVALCEVLQRRVLRDQALCLW